MDDSYLLGHRPLEHSRLSQQHVLWREGLLDTMRRHGLHPDAQVLDAGCGAGHLLADLGVLCRARGVEQDPDGAAEARVRAECEVVCGDLRTAPLGGPYDQIVARWVFSFLRSPHAIADRLATALSPDGVLIVQDYDHDGIGFWPGDPAITAVIEGYRAAYRAAGGDLWVAARLPALLAAYGWSIVEVVPEVKAGGPGTEVWRWVSRFLTEHLGGLVDGGQIDAGQVSAFKTAWARASGTPGMLFVSPIQLTVVARPPS
ncbi:MAG: SAM-dependent methyltransferase [Myxococcota bacterium]|jgi:SAM-dependent methyltransferase